MQVLHDTVNLFLNKNITSVLGKYVLVSMKLQYNMTEDQSTVYRLQVGIRTGRTGLLLYK